jgi:hypothetical protein
MCRFELIVWRLPISALHPVDYNVLPYFWLVKKLAAIEPGRYDSGCLKTSIDPLIHFVIVKLAFNQSNFSNRLDRLFLVLVLLLEAGQRYLPLPLILMFLFDQYFFPLR